MTMGVGCKSGQYDYYSQHECNHPASLLVKQQLAGSANVRFRYYDGVVGTLHTMGIRWMQYRSCFDGVSFKVSFRFSKFEEVESLLDGFSITSVSVMLYQWGTGEISNTGTKDT